MSSKRKRSSSIPSPHVELRQTNGQVGVYTTSMIPAGTCVVALAHVFVTAPSRYTIQIDANCHQAGTDEMDDFFNHSCSPNCYLDFDKLEFRALRDLRAGEQLTFNYLTSEWAMDAPFDCWCGSHECEGTIQGFSYLARERQQALASLISPYLRGKLCELESAVA